MGSKAITKKIIREIQSYGIKMSVFFPGILPHINTRVNYRNHRKIVVIDGKIGYVGGFNDNTLKSFKGDLKTNLVWGCGIRLSDSYMMAEALYENIAGYPHISVGVHFYLWDILGNKEY